MGEPRGGYSRTTPDAGSRYAERRRVPRYPATGEVEAFEPLTNARVWGRLTEISLSGCYASTAEPLPRHSVFQIRMIRDGEAVEAWARVVYMHPGQGMGISFLKVEEKQLGLLKTWLADLAAAN